MVDENKITMDTQNQEISNYIEQLKGGLIYYSNIPEEYRLHSAIVSAERELGIRKSIRKGYDIIKNTFFVEEIVLNKNWHDDIIENVITTLFVDFVTYYEFLQGDIYENACYYKYDFTQDEIVHYSIDIDKINFKALIDYTIDEFTLDFTQDEIKHYKFIEKRKSELKKWIAKFDSCNTYAEFKKILNNLERSKLRRYFKFFLYYLIYSNKEKAFDFVMQLINNSGSLNFVHGKYPLEIEKSLCIIYEPQRVFEAYNNHYYSKSFAKVRKRELKQFIENVENKNIEISSRSYFDTETHYFVCFYRIKNIKENSTEAEFNLYFENFGEFSEHLKYDLSYCDLSNAILPNLDLTKYKISEHTKLPIQNQENPTYSLSKEYDRQRKCFSVEQTWTNKYGKIIKNYNHTFNYFFDFIYFLKNNLSNADLLFCDGLKNITDFSSLDLNNARLKSEILDKLGVSYNVICNVVDDFDEIKANELETVNALIAEREKFSFDDMLRCQTVNYITDLHLLHRLHNANCKSLNDEIYVIQKIVDNIIGKFGGWKNIILIGGDTSSDFFHFELFVKLLRSSIDERKSDVKVIFTLGNHELWDFIGIKLDDIIDKYRKVIIDNKMYLLQNNLIFKYDWNNIEEISTEELKSLSKSVLQIRLNKARVILFGGIGFAGYNEKFNANQLIYKLALNRQQEIEESKKFEELYKKICADLSDRRVIIFTHMPQKDWCSNNTQIKGFIYVSGHTHRNYFYDDGDYRLYSDNQIGYYQENCRLKYFYLEDDYDIFATYEDGIYEITREDYLDFYRGKNMTMTFNRDFKNLYMLKKNGFYMFILQYSNGNLSILNGGAVKRLAHKAVYYYYEYMDKVISYIKTPLDNFSNYQKQIADEIKAIGGSGNIHGAIIDIDFFNHIYVNPVDLNVTAYWASDIINKVVFDDTPALLKSNCPDIYANYLKQIESNSDAALILNNSSIVRPPQFYLDTDIYRASREIKKMQKLSSNILSIWIEPERKKLSDNND